VLAATNPAMSVDNAIRTFMSASINCSSVQTR
jgi:hypothetical protein